MNATDIITGVLKNLKTMKVSHDIDVRPVNAISRRFAAHCAHRIVEANVTR